MQRKQRGVFVTNQCKQIMRCRNRHLTTTQRTCCEADDIQRKKKNERKPRSTDSYEVADARGAVRRRRLERDACCEKQHSPISTSTNQYNANMNKPTSIRHLKSQQKLTRTNEPMICSRALMRPCSSNASSATTTIDRHGKTEKQI
jgi:hypothetical protein